MVMVSSQNVSYPNTWVKFLKYFVFFEGITVAAGLFLLAQLIAITVWESLLRRSMKLGY